MIETLADSEARLLEQVADLAARIEWYRLTAQSAIHQLRAGRLKAGYQAKRIVSLIDEVRTLRAQLARREAA